MKKTKDAKGAKECVVFIRPHFTDAMCNTFVQVFPSTAFPLLGG